MITSFFPPAESMELRFAHSGSVSLSSSSGVLSLDESSTSQLLQAPMFIERLRFILSQPRFHHVISWLPEGKIWRIHKIDIFIAMVLPLFDEIAQWGSFLRLLKSYHFRELSSSVSSIAFYNEDFSRDASTPVVRPRVGVDRMTPLGTSAHALAQSTVPDTLFPTNFILDGGARGLRRTPPAVLEQPQVPVHFLQPETALLKVNKTRSPSDRMTLRQLLRGQHRAAAANMIQEMLPITVKETERKRMADASPQGQRKKPKKKWLPPLGPPESKSAAILSKRGTGL